MNLVSCNNCGTVLDKDKLKFPMITYDKYREPNRETAMYDLDYGDWVPKTECPVCNADISRGH
jgi:hypothetical protein